MMLKKKRPAWWTLVAFGIASVTHAEVPETLAGSTVVKHVLLLSVDGLHSLDVENYINSHKNSALAKLAGQGVRYTSATSSKPSDSFPGLLALVTGGSPVSTGVFYDVSYDRKMFDPANTTCQGTPGTAPTYDESLDRLDQHGNYVIDPTKLPRMLNGQGKCVPVYPHSFVRVNTIFEVVKAAGHRTAWADKHPAYDLVRGPSGKGVDDLYTPEITIPDGFDATVSVVCTAAYDAKKVKAIINEINGLDHDGKAQVGTPTLFGMNFQAVSVGQKLAQDNRDSSCTLPDPHKLYGQQGGYRDGSGTPSDILSYALSSTDAALGAITKALADKGLDQSTLIIVTAKHGQAPIDPAQVNKPGHLQDLVAALPGSGSNPAAQAIGEAAVTDDDVALIWLKDQSKTGAVATYLRENAGALFIQEVLAGDSLKLRFNDPKRDSRSPDLVVLPQFGSIFTASSKKIAEHGGFSDADTNVALLLSHPGLKTAVIKTPVLTTQVAPTILEMLGLKANALLAVRKEFTTALPGLAP